MTTTTGTCALVQSSCDVTLTYEITVSSGSGASAAQQAADAVDHLAVVSNYNSVADSVGLPAGNVSTSGPTVTKTSGSPVSTTTGSDGTGSGGNAVTGQSIQVVTPSTSASNYWVFAVLTAALIVIWAYYMSRGYRKARDHGLLVSKSEKCIKREEAISAMKAAEMEDYVAGLMEQAEAE
ncbi:unnamed protein product, partial [Phaeothamnion confervicola]